MFKKSSNKVNTYELELKGLLQDHCDLLGQRNIERAPYNSDSIERYRLLPSEHQADILERWRKTKGNPLLDYEFPDRETADEEREMLLAFLQYNEYQAPEGENFDFIEPGWVIEAYALNGMQTYRNIVFFRHCTYDLLTLEVYTWQELYERDEAVSEEIQAGAIKAFTEETETTEWDIRKHLIKEHSHPLEESYINRHRYRTPIFKDGQTVGALNFVESRKLKLSNGTVSHL